MGETARALLPSLNIEKYSDLNEPLYTATVIFKCFGKDFQNFQVRYYSCLGTAPETNLKNNLPKKSFNPADSKI